MTTMREQIARSISDAIVKSNREYKAAAKRGAEIPGFDIATLVDATLDALMSPTEGMLGSVVEHGVISYGGAKHAFTGMIRAAKEGK